MSAARGSALTGAVRTRRIAQAIGLRRLELPLLILVAVAIELVTVLPWIPRTGLFYDDWPLAQIAQFAGFHGVFDNLITANPLRPLAAFWFASTSALSSAGDYLHQLWAPLSHLAFVVTAFVLARRLGLGRPSAWALTALILVFPFSDSNWLWYTDSSSGVALTLATAGVLTSVHSLARSGRQAVWLDLAAGALFALSVLIYQFAAVAVLLLGMVYWSRCDRRATVRRMAINIGAVAAATLVPLAISGSAGSSAAQTIPVSQWPDHARQLADRGATLLADAAVPFGAPNRAIVLPIVAAVLIAGLIAVRLGARAGVKRWLQVAGAGLALIVAAYLVFVPTENGFYDPLGVAAANRVNALAGVGMCLLFVALAMVISALLRWRFPSAGLLAAAAPAVLLAILFVGFLVRLERDSRSWGRAATAQQHELARLWRLGRPAPGTIDYVYGGVGTLSSGVDAFQWPWELTGAVAMHWNDPTLVAYPVFRGTQITCGQTGVVAVGPLAGAQFDSAATYGHAVFSDVRSGRRETIGSRATCTRALRRFVAGRPD